MSRWLNPRFLTTLLALGLASLAAGHRTPLRLPERLCPMFSMGLRTTTSTCPPISSPAVWRKTSPS